ncbi:MAG: hypothetical protein ACREP9_13765 [Candidatus Dormibacteraceae bacterium]
MQQDSLLGRLRFDRAGNKSHPMPGRSSTPGAQLRIFEDWNGYRYQLILTDQWDADIASLELRHRLFHTAARVSHSGRQLIMRIQADWKWKKTLLLAFHRLGRLQPG